MEDNAFASRNDDESGRISSIRKVIEEAKDKSEKNAAMLAMLDDLVYPETKDGSTLDVSFFSTIIAWHLVRCGWRPDPSKRVIKPRRLIAKGLPPDARRWVSMDEPDEVDYTTLTMAEINQLDPRERAIAMRTLGGPESPELPPNPGWHVQTNIKIQDAPDSADDGYSWTGREYSK